METKPIKDYEGLYSISDTGLLIKHNKHSEDRLINGNQGRDGYLKVSLTKEGRSVQRKLHRLVAETFIANPSNKQVVDHIDEDKTNNKVTNLRWCTLQENNEYYNTKDGRRYHIELAKKRKEQLKTYESTLQELRKAITQKDMLLFKKEKELCKALKEVEQYKEQLNKKEDMLNKMIELEARKTEQTYTGYADIKGVTFKSIDEMIGVVGKPITINSIRFNSCGSAASYIVEEELKLGYLRKKATISKELRRYLQGRRVSWKMYERYLVE